MISAALVLGLGGLGCDSKGDEESATAADSDSEGTSDSDSGSTGGESASSTSGGSDSSGTSGVSGSSSDSSTGTSDSTGGSDTDATTAMTSTVTSATTNSSSVTTDATDGTDSDSTTGDPPAACGDLPAIDGLVTSMAYLKSQIPPDMTSGSSGSSTSSTSGGEIDPSTMYISLSSQAMECKDPNAGLECGPNWEVSIMIPPELQTPGVYHVGLEDVLGFAAETGPDEGNNECGFGGGTWEATLEIVAIDDSMVEARLCDVDEWFWSWTEPNLNGTFYAERCPG
jgi:hypothetical protein